jgi:hypothetical protein
VTTASDRRKQVVATSEVHRVDNVGNPGTENDESRVLIDHGIIDSTRGIVALVVRLEQFSS